MSEMRTYLPDDSETAYLPEMYQEKRRRSQRTRPKMEVLVGRSGIGGHSKPYRGLSDDWITPKFVLDALGEFDLDPCASETQPWPTAKESFTVKDDGLSQFWKGRCWVNSPYGPLTKHWLRKLAEHGNGIALVFARTETKMFFDWVWPKADALLFLEGRLYFCYPDGKTAAANAGGPSVLIAYGQENVTALETCGLKGALVKINRQQNE